jgi:hypothetical protein
MHQICYENKGHGKKRRNRINRIIIVSGCRVREHYRPSLAVDNKTTTSRYAISTRVGVTTIGVHNSRTNIANAASRCHQLQVKLTWQLRWLCGSRLEEDRVIWRAAGEHKLQSSTSCSSYLCALGGWTRKTHMRRPPYGSKLPWT